MNYREAVAWLYGLQLHGIKLGLESMRRLCAALDLPLGNTTFLHVAGTNGKGSVCAMLDAILRADGLRSGLYTSPHLVTFRERMRIDGAMISEDEVARRLSRIRAAIANWEPHPTFFEITTALALGWFADEKVEVAVLETGLGGRLDATNVVTPAASVITPVGLDHQRFLGDTIAEIAAEKAGIIKAGVPVVSAPQVPQARGVIARTAGERGCDFIAVDHPYERSPVALAGEHQRSNAAVAVAALQAAKIAVSRRAIEQGLASVKWPGRFQWIDDRFILDGAHNPAAARQLAETWSQVFGDEKATLILGVMRDKEVRGVSSALLPLASRVIAVQVDNPRSSTPTELADVVRSIAPGLACDLAPSVAKALVGLPQTSEKVLIAGSLFLVGEALSVLGLAEGEPERSEQ
jgi:dihydrofolate synthase/folylpolyglutamate synthase